jgi:hypothetical protein
MQAVNVSMRIEGRDDVSEYDLGGQGLLYDNALHVGLAAQCGHGAHRRVWSAVGGQRRQGKGNIGATASALDLAHIPG